MKCNTILIAVKPDKVPKVLSEISPGIDKQKHLLISVAAGVKISTIQQVGKPGKLLYCFILDHVLAFAR